MQIELDKFYTKSFVVDTCINSIKNFYDLAIFDNIIEPSCGNGAFLKKLPKKTIGLDIEPSIEGCLKQNYFSFQPQLKGKTLVIGNPPFGIGGKDAIKFFNKSAEFSDVIAFIVPRTFRRVSIQNRLNSYFHLKFQENILEGSFIPSSMQAKCVFQIWEKNKKSPRIKVLLPSASNDFYFTKDASKATIAIKAYGGSGDCGKIETKFEALNKKAYHFIICKKNIIERFEVLDYYPLASYTVRQDSIGQKELIQLYNTKFKFKEDLFVFDQTKR